MELGSDKYLLDKGMNKWVLHSHFREEEQLMADQRIEPRISRSLNMDPFHGTLWAVFEDA